MKIKDQLKYAVNNGDLTKDCDIKRKRKHECSLNGRHKLNENGATKDENLSIHVRSAGGRSNKTNII
jgi:hypothetical protein